MNAAPVAFSSWEEFDENIWGIQRDLETLGFALLEPWESSPEILAEVCSHFGVIQRHIRSDERGFVDVKPAKPTEAIDGAVYFGTKSARFEPHTDGSYLHGLRMEKQGVVRVTPPKLIALQCIEPANEGGENFLIDMQAVVRDLVKEEPLHAAILFRDGAVSFCRDDQIAMDFPLFKKVGKSAFAVRFRSDEMTYVQHWAFPSISHLQKNYLRNEKYTVRLRLERNQILIVDNTRMLHGREDIPASPENLKRHLRRAWIADDNRSILLNFTDRAYSHRAFQGYEQYGTVGATGSRPKKIRLKLGIKLEEDQQLAVENVPALIG
jgi:hypothetical protein